MAPSIDRRKFLAGSLGLGAYGALHKPLRGLDLATRVRPAPVGATAPTGSGVLVLVTMYGGNDGLDMVVPYEDPAYYAQRPGVAIAADTVLPLDDGLGLHPSLPGMKALWDAGNLAVIRGVGYPDPDYSHFESMDIWQSGDPSGDVDSGWLGRWLDRTGKDPLRSLVVGSNLPLAFMGDRQQASAIVTSLSPNAQLLSGTAEMQTAYRTLMHHGGDTMGAAVALEGANMVIVGDAVAQGLLRAPSMPALFGATPTGLSLQLAIVSQLIRAGMPTRAYGVSIGGFDSHAGELNSYAPLYKQLDAAISSFFKSIAGAPNASDVVMLLYSEVGRRVNSNASEGTDHGSGNTAFAIGTGVKGGFYGDQPSLTSLDKNESLVVTTDFRTVYVTVLEKVLDMESRPILSANYPGVPFLP